MRKKRNPANGYSLVELLVATVLFTIIAGSVFSLLFSAQLRYRGESDVTTAFQQANVAIDQITRDVHSAGYPPPNSFAAGVLLGNPALMAVPFSWSSGYPNTPCTVGSSGCGTVPGDYDLILETDMGDGKGVQWIRYSLDGTTLKRGILPKSASDPVSSTSGVDVLVPYLDNVLNGSQGVAIFSYSGDVNSVGPLLSSDIQKVDIKLIVQSAEPDPQTHQFRTITLTGQAVCFNPNY
jgi:prepilin-type N-terminal cleavage/methylation domain-containing protein